ncbi:thiol:disulfide interchange protein DsbA/DsbL [Pasteurellaceae bacterium HPA106]|uniref:thiol:disulfide interchange protein DsbA/DsbL n=1 Tax=Spirabiliibacterium pneumoniae TaxID=221400 RepID=UPI001AAD3A12|nr:thiol:disulfide interchange protein DsbA/DsbL [Spirabiliibacterium pneumoniae]MBE2896976.1 thiol:disulfide interchange protein DsbA/DsbL [Spirabiliibacterium pneumoniae]
MNIFSHIARIVILTTCLMGGVLAAVPSGEAKGESAVNEQSAVAQPAQTPSSQPAKGVVFKDGKDFFSYKDPIALEPKAGDDRIEISLFFTYECPYCSTAYDNLILYQRLHDEQVVLNVYPVALSTALFSANVFNGLVAMDKRDLAELLIFDSAVNQGKTSLVDAKNLYYWLVEHDISPDAFLTMLRSDLIVEQAKQAVERSERYGVFTVPFVVINGEYVLTRSTLYNDDYTFAVLDYLISHILNRKTEQK